MAFEKINEFAADKQKLCVEHDTISDELFREYGVNRGLRDINGKGVLTGLTRISKVVSFKDENGEHVPCDGELWYRGYNINTLIKNLDGFGFEKTAYLLIFGEMPTAQQLAEFNDVLTECRTLPSNFTRDVIMKAPSKDIMNSMTKSILTLSSYDDDIASNSIDNCIRQCLQLTAVFPMLAVYGYHAYNHYENDDSMYIHRRRRGFPPRRTSCGCSARICSTPSLRHGCWTSCSCSTWSTAAETTPRSRPASLPPPVRIHIPR